MSTFTVLYNGQRKTIKATQSALMQAVVIEAAEKFGLDPNKCFLLHKKVVVDKTQSVRFCSIPNLAQIELQYNEGLTSKSSAILPACRIAMSVLNGVACTGTFPANTKVSEMLTSFIDQGMLPSSLLSGPYEVIYLRTSVTGDALTSTSLGDLGLAGQGGRLQFRHTVPSASVVVEEEVMSISRVAVSSESTCADINIAAVGADTTDTTDAPDVISMAIRNPIPIDMTNVGLPPQVPVASSAMEVEVATDGGGEVEKSHPTTADDTFTLTSDTSTPIPVADLNRDVVSMTVDDRQYEGPTSDIDTATSTLETTTTAPAIPAEIRTVSESRPKIAKKRALPDSTTCIEQLLSQNFDRVSTPCVLTIAKYVLNILSDPTNTKYRTLNASNKTFLEKVMTANGAQDLIYSIGFVEVPGTTTLRNDSSVEVLETAMGLLIQAMERLNIPLVDRPKQRAAQPVVNQAPVEEWDPYKSSIVRTAPQPTRGGKSVTEVQLEQLYAHRRKLEGTLESVERRTEVLMPRSDGAMASMQEYLNANNASGAEDEESEVSDSTLIARSLAAKMRAGRGEEEEEPMTTAAVRELRRLQRERVYSYTLIRVKFPDRVCIQGYFHLRHTVLDVYQWVNNSLNLDESEEKGDFHDKKKDSGADFFRFFELYTSPPRCVLHPYAKSSSENESYSGSGSGSVGVGSTQGKGAYLPLIEAHLVPAALIHLSWGPDHPEYKERDGSKVPYPTSSSSSSASATSCGDEEGVEPAFGRYLSSTLLSHASSKDSKETYTITSSYPLGEALAPRASGGTRVGKSEAVATADGKSDGNERSQGKENKPKWLKIGKF